MMIDEQPTVLTRFSGLLAMASGWANHMREGSALTRSPMVPRRDPQDLLM
jgi:hypothetical protein